MKSDDDPEARIRQLEQPLADAARASEAGGNPPPSKWAPPPAFTPNPPPAYTATPPPGPDMPYTPPAPDMSYTPPGAGMPPPVPYGGLFPTPPRSSNRSLWIIVGIFVLGLFIAPLGIFFFTAHQVSRSGITTLFPTPTYSPAGPTASATMSPPVPTAPSIPSAPVTPAPAGGNVTVSGISESRTIACNGGTVSVSGITNTVVITGHCGSVHVSGIQNQITVDSADAIETSGSGNQITYHTGTPKTENSGFGNMIQKG
jgi:hypothetical protein